MPPQFLLNTARKATTVSWIRVRKREWQLRWKPIGISQGTWAYGIKDASDEVGDATMDGLECALGCHPHSVRRPARLV